jgi:hypothetical protein
LTGLRKQGFTEQGFEKQKKQKKKTEKPQNNRFCYLNNGGTISSVSLINSWSNLNQIVVSFCPNFRLLFPFQFSSFQNPTSFPIPPHVILDKRNTTYLPQGQFFLH